MVPELHPRNSASDPLRAAAGRGERTSTAQGICVVDETCQPDGSRGNEKVLIYSFFLMGRAGIEPATLGLKVAPEARSAEIGRDETLSWSGFARFGLGLSRWVVLPPSCPPRGVS